MINAEQYAALAERHGTPLYIYDSRSLKQQARSLLDICNGAGVSIRYAVKANNHPRVIKLFDGLGLGFDASSDYEAETLVSAGVEPAGISLSSQQPPKDMARTLASGLNFVATSLHQLELVSATGYKGRLGVRLNPGIGSGHNNRTTTGGAGASFGIWHEYLPQVMAWQAGSGCTIDRLHIHIGSGTDPKAWRKVIQTALEIAGRMPDVTNLDIGGGYKVARMPGEAGTDMKAVIDVFARELEIFRQRTGRELQLEIEPGTWLVAGAGVLLAEIVDIVDTGAGGFNFLRLNTGMNDFLRPTLYGAQHPIEVLNSSKTGKDYVVVGHNCESGDILTPAPGNPELIRPRRLNTAKIGDLVTIGMAGAYGATMRAVGYNSFPAAKEIFV